MLKILPQLFYQDPKITKVLVDGLSCVVHKQLSEPVLRKEGYVSTHAITLVLKGILRAETDEGVAKQVNENEMIFLPKGIYTYLTSSRRTVFSKPWFSFLTRN